MAKKSDEEILECRKNGYEKIGAFLKEDATLLDSFFTEESTAANSGLYYLSKSIEKLADADIAFFLNGWETARGCRLEYECAKAYGIPIILESDLDLDFLDFLYNHINPNEMEKYLAMYHAKSEYKEN